MVDSGPTLRTTAVVLVVSTGITIVGIASSARVPSLDTVGSMIALTAFAAPLTYACYKYSLSVSVPTTTGTNDVDEMDAEEVKRRTERWSEEAALNPAFPPGQGPNRQASTAGQNGPTSSVYDSESRVTENQDLDANQCSSSIDLSDLEFGWQTETGVNFDDIGGMDDIKDELRAEVIKPLENPKKAEELGVTAPNLILHGPPGTGKTFCAEALATELGLPFTKLSGSDVQSKWINESSTKVNDLFSEAKELAACEGGSVVFLDELDSVLKNRSGGGGAHEEDNKVVNEFLNHLEDTTENNIVFVGATNRLGALDDAGIRSGRIDLKIHVGKPDTEAREAILHAQLADREHEISDDAVADLAAATDGAVAADLEQLVNRAAKNVLLRGGDTIYRSDFD